MFNRIICSKKLISIKINFIFLMNFFIISYLITDVTEAIKCYRCTVGPSYRTENQTQQLCAKFTESDSFSVDCPYSTMCMKKIFRYQLLDGSKIETVSRSCAPQKNTSQVSDCNDTIF